MRLSRSALLAIVALGLVAAPVSAKLTPKDDTLYTHSTDCGSGPFWMNTDKDDPDHVEGACGYFGTATARGVSWSFPLDPDPNATIPLRSDGSVKLIAEFSTVGTAQVDVDTVLKAGDTVVADPGAKTKGPVALGRFNVTWEVQPEVDAVPANATLNWTVSVSGASGLIYFEMNDEGWSRLRLPVREANSADPAAETEETGQGSGGSGNVSNQTNRSNASPSSGGSPSPSSAPGESTPGFSAVALLGAAAAALVLLRRRRR